MIQKPKVMAETPSFQPAVAALSEALRMVRLTGAVYLRGEFSAPWGFESPSAQDLVQALRPEAEQIIIFHAIIEGVCEVRLESGESVTATEGDFVILPFGQKHTMLSPGTVQCVPIDDLLPPAPWASMLMTQLGHVGGPVTRVLCSYLECGDVLFSPLLRALPPLMKITPQRGPAAEWMHAGLAYLAGLGPDDLRRDALGARLPELLLVETLRQHFATQPNTDTGWLAGLADPVIGDALMRIHSDPSHPWSVPLLAQELGVSRSVLAARFVERLGLSPMRYVALWRRQLASHLLQTTELPLSAIAQRVGYESEAAFSRAFKRSSGVAPGAWRSQRKAG